MSIANYIRRIERRIYLDKKRKKLKNKNPSVLSANCNGAMILHDLQCRFNSPTVNLYIEAADFLKFLSLSPKSFMNLTLLTMTV